ncbi:acetylserotonin O-methyltransferase-like [Thamnophis elegans]|uniref:acetylserotonin O-methyltransferase-like n=1 Tax=Thamnophis elegans TaxID=35005 RepID=UPI001378EC57|nr:acetylserotonin O-methyltransferase-like [Thamnophis elegans]
MVLGKNRGHRIGHRKKTLISRLVPSCGRIFKMVRSSPDESHYSEISHQVISEQVNARSSSRSLGKVPGGYTRQVCKSNRSVRLVRRKHQDGFAQKGKNQIPSIYGSSSNKTYEVMYRSKEELQTLSNFMKEIWPVVGREVLSAFDLSQFPLICDLGGNTDDLAKELTSFYPKCTVTIFDRPEVVEASKNHGLPSEETRITFHAGDFFKDPIPEADLYILARILHNWSDERCLQLLSKVYQACKPGGGVLIVEMLLDEDRRGPLATHFYSMLMLLYTEGREWSASEFNVLLCKAGFQTVELKKGSLFYIILGRK